MANGLQLCAVAREDEEKAHDEPRTRGGPSLRQGRTNLEPRPVHGQAARGRQTRGRRSPAHDGRQDESKGREGDGAERPRHDSRGIREGARKARDVAAGRCEPGNGGEGARAAGAPARPARARGVAGLLGGCSAQLALGRRSKCERATPGRTCHHAAPHLPRHDQGVRSGGCGEDDRRGLEERLSRRGHPLPQTLHGRLLRIGRHVDDRHQRARVRGVPVDALWSRDRLEGGGGREWDCELHGVRVEGRRGLRIR